MPINTYGVALSTLHPGEPELHDCVVSEHGSKVGWPLPIAAHPAGDPPVQVTSLVFGKAPFGQQKTPFPLKKDEPPAHAASPEMHAA